MKTLHYIFHLCVPRRGEGGGQVQDRFSKRNHVYVSCGQTWCEDSWWLKCLWWEPWLLYAHVNLLVCEINSNCSAESTRIHYSSTRRHLCKTRRHARSVTYYYPPVRVTHPLIIDSLTGGWKFMQLKTQPCSCGCCMYHPLYHSEAEHFIHTRWLSQETAVISVTCCALKRRRLVSAVRKELNAPC